MKWLTLLLLIGCATGQTLIDGGGDGMILPRWPPYETQQTLTFNILTPENTTYYHNTVNLTITGISGGVPPYTCRYRVVGYDWNNYDCEDKQVTWPQGTQTIEVEATDSLGNSGTATQTFTIILYLPKPLWGGMVTPAWGVLLIALYLLLFEEEDENTE
jgi:hypothetical protein